MQYIIVFKRFGKLIALYDRVFQDAWWFTFLFSFYILTFALIAWIVKLEIDPGDYDEIPFYFQYILYTWRNSIGDINGPLFEFWKY